MTTMQTVAKLAPQAAAWGATAGVAALFLVQVRCVACVSACWAPRPRGGDAGRSVCERGWRSEGRRSDGAVAAPAIAAFAPRAVDLSTSLHSRSPPPSLLPTPFPSPLTSSRARSCRPTSPRSERGQVPVFPPRPCSFCFLKCSVLCKKPPQSSRLSRFEEATPRHRWQKRGSRGVPAKVMGTENQRPSALSLSTKQWRPPPLHRQTASRHPQPMASPLLPRGVAGARWCRERARGKFLTLSFVGPHTIRRRLAPRGRCCPCPEGPSESNIGTVGSEGETKAGAAPKSVA
jgi:hypothetical protein